MHTRLPAEVLAEAYERQGVALLTLTEAVVEVIDVVGAPERALLVETLLDVRAQARGALEMLERAHKDVREAGGGG